MTNDPRESAELEQQMLEHYRRHSEQLPPPALDARILAAAQAQAEVFAQQQQQQPAKTPVLSRLHGWLFGGSQRARWSMAFASIATLGIGVGLATRTIERSPEQFDAVPLSFSVPAPAPAMAPRVEAVDPDAYYATEPQAEKKAASAELTRPRPELRKQAAPVIISGQLNENINQDEAASAPAAAPFADAAVPEAPLMASKAKADKESDEAHLQRNLKQILDLQQTGQADLAQQQLHTLQQLYPQRDLSQELQRLRLQRGQQ